MATSAALERAAATAMQRVELSRPVRLALEAGVIQAEDAVFDYGCGHGHDVQFLRALGHVASGWDPYHRPEEPLVSAPVVNFGYVLNVIEREDERAEALHRAWKLATRALVVAVRTTNEVGAIARATDHADGVITGANTFQRLFGQAEARTYIDDCLAAQSIPLGVGVFVVFKDDAAEQEWLDNRSVLRRRVRRLRRLVEPRKSLRDRSYDEHREVLRPLEEFIAQRGRIPVPGEHPWTELVVDAFGSLPKAFQVIRHVAEDAWWDDAADDRRDELLVRFALARLRKRPKFTALPHSLQRDVKALFGSYKAACSKADDLLFSIGDPDTIVGAAAGASVGKHTPDAHYVHVDAVDLLPAPLRVFIGAAEALIGEIPEAALIKAHLNKPRVSFLVYPDFENAPHPTLSESWVVDFRELDVRPHDYSDRANPPILHRKELFVSPDHPRHATFKRLTEHEERVGLLDDPLGIGTRDAWNRRLAEAGWKLRGHRLVRSQPAP